MLVYVVPYYSIIIPEAVSTTALLACWVQMRKTKRGSCFQQLMKERPM